jgi:hypothetical protein
LNNRINPEESVKIEIDGGVAEVRLTKLSEKKKNEGSIIFFLLFC